MSGLQPAPPVEELHQALGGEPQLPGGLLEPVGGRASVIVSNRPQRAAAGAERRSESGYGLPYARRNVPLRSFAGSESGRLLALPRMRTLSP